MPKGKDTVTQEVAKKLNIHATTAYRWEQLMQMFNGQIGHPGYLQMVSPRLLERLGPASVRGAGGFDDGGFAGFTGLRGIAIVLGNLGRVSQLLRIVVVQSYFHYYLFYIQLGSRHYTHTDRRC
jgi:hypothetical protein